MISTIKLSKYKCLQEVLLPLEYVDMFKLYRGTNIVECIPKPSEDITRILGNENWNIPRVGINSDMMYTLKFRVPIKIKSINNKGKVEHNKIYIVCEDDYTWPADLFEVNLQDNGISKPLKYYIKDV